MESGFLCDASMYELEIKITHGSTASKFSLAINRGENVPCSSYLRRTKKSGGTMRGWSEIDSEVAEAIEQGDFVYAKRAVYEDDGVLSNSSRRRLLDQIRKAEAKQTNSAD